MVTLVIKQLDDEEYETIETYEYERDDFVAPEVKQLVIFEDDEGEDQRYFIENVAHRFDDDGAKLELFVRDEEEVIREMRERQRQMQRMQQAQQGGGGNPFGGGGGGGGNQGGGDSSPFTL